MLPDLKISQKYATALFEAANKGNYLSDVINDLTFLQEALAKSPEIFKSINSPIYDNRKRAQFMTKLSDRLKFHKATSNFLAFAADHNRLNWLSQMIKQVFELYREQSNEKLVEVTSAEKLTAEQESEIAKSLAEKLNKTILIKSVIDPTIIGGVIIKVDSFVIDNSITNRLNDIQLFIKNEFNIVQASEV